MRYAAHRHLVDPAKAANASAWHLLGGCALIFFTAYFLTAVVFEGVLAWTEHTTFADALFDGTTPEAMFVLLFSFAVWPIAIWIALLRVHKRAFAPMIGPDAIDQFTRVTALLVALNIVILILPPWDFALPEGQSFQPNLDFGRWLVLLPLSLLAVLVQVTSEEVLFRGYLQQQLAARWNAPLIWMAVPSVLFGLAHYDADAGSNAWLVVLWAIMFGLMMADLTARAGSLGPAIALHFVNNLMAMLLIGLPESLSGLALYHYPMGMDNEAAIRALLPLDVMFVVVSWLGARLAIRR